MLIIDFLVVASEGRFQACEGCDHVGILGKLRAGCQAERGPTDQDKASPPHSLMRLRKRLRVLDVEVRDGVLLDKLVDPPPPRIKISTC